MEKVLGKGMLTWMAGERRSDRYGSVFLSSADSFGNGDVSVSMDETVVRAHVGDRGRLVAKVIETRDSTHIGDMFRGIGPTTPYVGESINLGSGTLFIESPADEYGSMRVGLRPDDGRNNDWLDIKALYRAHEQTVELVFEPLQ